ncbi:MAG: response regulator, partial [Henriciella sp.]|nr:response regulator [Henriciella sp.]
MSLVEQFGPHLPFLRRYARALTGSQESGDSYIRASLTALAEDPSQVSDELPARQALYRFFHVIWGSTGARLERPGGAMTPETRLQALAPIERQAFLLTALEGFQVSEAATILGKTVQQVEELIAKAHTDIEDTLSTKVLIIEDEPVIAADLESLVEELGHEVTGNATTHTEAVAMARANPPGLILCDIQLADNSSGIEAAHEILEELDVPIIFISAFPER